MDYLEISWEIAVGSANTDKSSKNPFSRALSKLLDQGKPFKRINLCFFDQSFSKKPLERKCHWFGSFVVSDADRLVYFPGINLNSPITIRRDISESQQLEFQLDHLSLERNLVNWHITGTKTEHHGGFLTSDLGSGRRLWFGMTLSSVKFLLPLSKRTEITCETPENDSKRRMNVLKKASQKARFHILQLPEQNKINPEYVSLHFAVIVGPSKFPVYNGSDLKLPFGSQYFSEPLPSALRKVPVRVHRIKLSKDIDIQISTIMLPRKLNIPVIFSCLFK